MEASSESLADKAFGPVTDPGLIVAYQSHQDALRFLTTSLGQANGVALLLGPPGSGKTTLAREQLDWFARETPIAFLDATGLSPQDLTAGMLLHYNVKPPSRDEQMRMQALNSFLVEQTKSGRSPILILDNADRTSPSTMRLLNWLAALEVRGNFALRIILTGKSRLSSMMKLSEVRNIRRRNPSRYTLNPMTLQESILYLRNRYIAAGGKRSEKAFSVEVCEHLHSTSGGWPGTLNGMAAEMLEIRKDLKAVNASPRLIVSRDGEEIGEYHLTEPRYIVGRTGFADIVIEDQFISKMHLLLRLYSNAIVLLDLNSTNGTTVNSVVTQKTILRNNDIITLGRYRLKLENGPAVTEEVDERITSADTLRLQHIGDYRRKRAKRSIKIIKKT